MLKNWLTRAYHVLFDLEWKIWSTGTRIYFALTGSQYGAGLRSFGLPMVRRSRRASIRLAQNVTLVNLNRANPIGINQPCMFIAGEAATISIGAHTGLSGCVINARANVSIGCHVLIGGNVRIFDHDFHPVHWQARRGPDRHRGHAAPIVIEEDAFIGEGALILKGVTIGRGAVIGARAVVTHSVEPLTIWAGNPARLIARLTDDELPVAVTG